MEALKKDDTDWFVPDILRELVINRANFYKWSAKYGAMDTSMIDLTLLALAWL